MRRQVTVAYAEINARIMPIARGRLFEEPLMAALKSKGYGEVGGGGTLQAANKEIIYCGIDVDLFDVERGVPFVCEFLAQSGAPRGSKFQYKADGNDVSVPFGNAEGVGIYLNGTDLPDEVYQTSDINVVMETLNRLLGEHVAFKGYWQGPTETALYLYGQSEQRIRQIIAPFINEYPLCQKARIVTIA